jgi:hypothetical protein
VSPFLSDPKTKMAIKIINEKNRKENISAAKSKNKNMTGFSDIFSIHRYGRSEGITFFEM